MSAPHPAQETVWLRPEAFGFHTPHEKQLKFLHLPHRNGYYCGGFGSGKTEVLLYWAIQEAMDPRNRRRVVGLAAPTHDIADKAHRPRLLAAFDVFAQQHGFSLLEHHDIGRKEFHLLGGGCISQFSYENKPTRNASLEFCALGIDEIDKEPGGAAHYGYLSGRVRGGGTHRIRCVSTPSGYQGVVKLFMDARGNPETAWRYGLIHSPSWANPAMAEQVEEWRHTMSAAQFRENVEALILAPGWAVWPEFDPERHVVNWYPPKGEHIEWRAAVDWGYNVSYVIAAARARKLYPHAPDVEPWVVFGQAVFQEAAESAPIGALERMRRDIGCDPVAINPDSSHPKLNQQIRRVFPGVPVNPKDGKHEVWKSVQRVRAWLDPADESPARLLFSRSVHGGELNIVQCAQNYARKRVKGVVLDQVAETQPWEHGADCVRYLVEGIEGGARAGLYMVGAV